MYWWCGHPAVCCAVQIQSEFPQILPIRESLIKYVFEPNAAKVRIASQAGVGQHVTVTHCALLLGPNSSTSLE